MFCKIELAQCFAENGGCIQVVSNALKLVIESNCTPEMPMQSPNHQRITYKIQTPGNAWWCNFIQSVPDVLKW